MYNYGPMVITIAAQGMHAISFTTSRVPDAVALTNRQVLVDQGSRIRRGAEELGRRCGGSRLGKAW